MVYARKYSNISAGISRKTLAKYIDLAFVDLKKQIKEDLPPTFGIIFDGWTCDSEHYIANVATWTNDFAEALYGSLNKILMLRYNRDL